MIGFGMKKTIIYIVFLLFVAFPVTLAAGLTFLAMTWRDFACRCHAMDEANTRFYDFLKGHHE